jgi:hypothetical protein
VRALHNITFEIAQTGTGGLRVDVSPALIRSVPRSHRQPDKHTCACPGPQCCRSSAASRCVARIPWPDCGLLWAIRPRRSEQGSSSMPLASRNEFKCASTSATRAWFRKGPSATCTSRKRPDVERLARRQGTTPAGPSRGNNRSLHKQDVDSNALQRPNRTPPAAPMCGAASSEEQPRGAESRRRSRCSRHQPSSQRPTTARRAADGRGLPGGSRWSWSLPQWSSTPHGVSESIPSRSGS